MVIHIFRTPRSYLCMGLNQLSVHFNVHTQLSQFSHCHVLHPERQPMGRSPFVIFQPILSVLLHPLPVNPIEDDSCCAKVT